MDPRVQKVHNQGLKHDIQIWPPHPHLGVGVGQKPRITSVFTTSSRFLTYLASLQAKMNASIVFSVKKSLKTQVFSLLAEKVQNFVGLCNIYNEVLLYSSWQKIIEVDLYIECVS